MVKTYTIFAGVNGAGKSTFHSILNQDFGIRINLDVQFFLIFPKLKLTDLK